LQTTKFSSIRTIPSAPELHQAQFGPGRGLEVAGYTAGRESFRLFVASLHPTLKIVYRLRIFGVIVKTWILHSLDTVYTRVYTYIKGENMKTVKVFKSGNSQAVRIPKEYQFNEKELIMNRIGNTIILFPGDDPWKLFRDSLREFSDDFFVDGRKQPAMQKRRVN